MFPCDGGRSFRLIVVWFLNNFVQTQAFTSSYAVLSRAPPLEGRWGGEVDGRWGGIYDMELVGPMAKLARHSLPPVFLGHVAYWLCKTAGKYHVVSLRVDTMQEASIQLPPECSSTGEFNRKKILLVPSTPEKRLGLLTVGGEVLTVTP